MVKSLTSSTLTLPNLLGIAVADSPCVLSPDQFVRVGALLLRCRPADPRAVCFLGGALTSLLEQRRGGHHMVSLEGDLGNDPFLVIAGPQGSVALLASESPAGFHTRLLSDPELSDRAAMVLSQFGDYSYNLDTMSDPDSQRLFITAVIVALLNESELREADLRTLLVDERTWLELGQELQAAPVAADLLELAPVRAMFSEYTISKALAGALDAGGQQLRTLAALGAERPGSFDHVPSFILGAAQAQRSGSATIADSGMLTGSLGDWAFGHALTAIPLIQSGQTWGIMLVASERPLSVSARATLCGLSSLLATRLHTLVAPPARRIDEVPAAPPPAAPAAGGLAARLSGLARMPAQARQAARPTPAPVAANGAPATTIAPAPLAPAPSLAQRTLALQRSTDRHFAEVAALLEHLSDGVAVVDGQGRLVAFTRTAMQMLHLQRESRGRSLVESGALCLTPLFTEALTGDLDGPQHIDLPGGRHASVDVISLDDGMWAFVLHADDTQPAVSAAVAAEALPTPADGDRSESFLTNFSNIIRVPLRELRELITQVPAAGNLNEQQSRLIGQVVRLNSELTMLVNDLLALGQIRLETSEARIPLRLDLLVEAAVGTQYAEFGRRGQHVTTEIQPGLPRISGSEEGLGRAVAALIDNAIKYSPAGAQIKVSVAHSDNEVTVSVQDNGPGLEPGELAQSFDPFFRAASTERLGVAGRGLGLTIAKAVIEQHGGRIWAAGEPGRGCAFSFSLPSAA